MAKLAKVEGLMVVSDGHNGAFTEFFEREFVLSDDIKNLGHARSFLRKSGMLHDALKRDVRNFKRVYEAQVIEFGDSSEKVDEDDKEIMELTTKAMELNCNVEFIQQYGSVGSKKRALEEMITKAEERNARNKKKKKADNIEDMGYID